MKKITQNQKLSKGLVLILNLSLNVSLFNVLSRGRWGGGSQTLYVFVVERVSSLNTPAYSHCKYVRAMACGLTSR